MNVASLQPQSVTYVYVRYVGFRQINMLHFRCLNSFDHLRFVLLNDRLFLFLLNDRCGVRLEENNLKIRKIQKVN